MPASASAFACACACARILPRPRHSPEVRLAGEYRPRRVPPPASTARASTPSDQDRHWLESPTGDLARPDRRPFAACGFSDLRAGFVLRDESGRRQRSRAPHESGRAAPEHDPGSPALGTRPQPLGVLRSTNWARISEEPGARATPTPATPAWLPTQGAGPPGRGPFTGIVAPRLVCERGSPFAGAVPPRARAAWRAEHEPKPRPVVRPPTGPEIGTYERASACSGGSPGRLRRKSGGSPGPAEVRWAPGADMAPGAINRAGAVARGCVRGRASRYVPPPRRRPPRRHDSGASLRRRPDAAAPTPRTRHGAPTLPRCGPRPQTAARRYNPGRCRTPSSS